MHHLRVLALMLCACSIAPAALGAGPPPHLGSLVEQAWQRSPTARGIAARQAEVEAGRALSGSWIAGQPVLGLAQRAGRTPEQGRLSESEVSMSAPFWTPGQRSARQHVAQQSLTDWQSQVRKARLDLAGEVRTRLWDAGAAKATRDEKQGYLEHTIALAADVARRVKAGELARTDGLLAQQEVEAARIAVAQAETEAQASMARLRLLTGPLEELPVVHEPPPGTAITAADHPRVQAAREAERLAEAGRRLAIANRSEPATLSLSMRRERDTLLAQAERSVGVALQVPIGTAGRNRPAEAQAHSLAEIAAAEARQSEEQIKIEQELAHQQVQHAQKGLTAAQARVAAASEHEQLIEKAFRLGERGLADALRARLLAHEARVGLRQQEVTLGRALAQLNQASGVLP